MDGLSAGELASLGALFVAGFAALWVLVCLLLARLGGWAELAHFYAGEVRVPRERWRMRSGSMRYLTSYNNVLTITVGDDGLGLGILVLFRPGHPALKVPWSDIEAAPDRFVFMDAVRLTFRRAPGVYLRITAALAQRIGAARGEPLLRDGQARD